MIHFVLWKWLQPNFREVYTAQHVNIVARMVLQNTPALSCRVVCVTDQPEGIEPPTVVKPLWGDHDDLPNATARHLPSCYRRLKLFDRATQEQLGIPAGDRIVSFDLDSIILRPWNDVFTKADKARAMFTGWGVRGTYHQTVFNGSFWTFRAGDDRLQFMWDKFDPVLSPKLCLSKGFLGSDQSWLSMNLAYRDDVLPIRFPEFASYPREVRRQARVDARTMVVFFHGSRKPWHVHEVRQQPWITKHWR